MRRKRSSSGISQFKLVNNSESNDLVCIRRGLVDQREPRVSKHKATSNGAGEGASVEKEGGDRTVGVINKPADIVFLSRP